MLLKKRRRRTRRVSTNRVLLPVSEYQTNFWVRESISTQRPLNRETRI
jgi:hypothetical protein